MFGSWSWWLKRFSAALLVLFAFAALPALGQTRVRIYPQIVERVVTPGSTFQEQLSFENAGTTPVNVSLEYADLDVDEKGNAIKSPPATRPQSLVPHLRVSPLRVNVPPGATVRFRVVARVPEDLRHKRMMLYFLARPAIDRAESGSRTVIVPKIGVPIYVESTEAAKANLSMDEVGFDRIDDALVLTMRTTNSGERIIRPPGTLEVTGPDGFFEVFDVNEGIDPVYPGMSRDWTFRFGPVPDGELETRLIFATSLRESYEESFVIPAREGEPSDSETSSLSD